MEFALAQLRPPWNRFVESVTWFAGAMPAHAREKLIPDGAIQIIVDLTERPKKLFAGEADDTAVDFRGAWISGMHLKPIVIEAQQHASMLVVRFRPGGAYPFIRNAAEAITGDVITLEDMVGRAAVSLRERALEARSMPERVAAVEAWLFASAAGVPEIDPLVRYLARRLWRPMGLRIADLAEETGYSQRQVLSICRRWIGITPKQYARVRRFGVLLETLCAAGREDVAFGGEALPEPHWADVATQFGYADQAHFNHEFLQLSGMTPGAYVRAYRGLPNYLPIGVNPEV